MIKRGLVVVVKGFPRTGEAFNNILYSIKKSSDTGGVLYEKMQPVLSQWTVVFLAAALNFVTGKNHSTAVVWLCLGSSCLCLGYSQQKK